MNFKKSITGSRNAYALQMKDRESYWYLSPITLALYKDILLVTKDINLGKLLDAGAGGLNGKMLFINKCESYTSFDIQDRTGEIDMVGDVQNMASIDDESYDTVYCSQVLEHIPEPSRAIEEFYRILKMNGQCIISVPHISHYHEEPNDYYRFTEYGLKYLIEINRMEVLEIKRQNSLIGLIFHPLSVGLISLSWRIPLLKWIVYFFNRWLIVVPIYHIEKMFFFFNRFPVNILIIARKKS